MKAFAMLTCDGVTVDGASGKHFILGHFSSIKVGSFPATHSVLTLFVGLTDVSEGEHLLVLKGGMPGSAPAPVKKTFPWDPKPPADPMQVILTQNVKSSGPAQKLYLISEIKDLYLEKAGSYQLQLIIDGAEVGNVTLAVS